MQAVQNVNAAGNISLNTIQDTIFVAAEVYFRFAIISMLSGVDSHVSG